MQIAPNVFTLPPSMLSSPALVITPFSPHKNLLWGIKSQMNILLIMSRFSPVQFSSVTQVVSDSLWSHGLQHARLPCPSPTPGTFSNSGPSSGWCHPTISFYVYLLSKFNWLHATVLWLYAISNRYNCLILIHTLFCTIKWHWLKLFFWLCS